MNVGDLIQILPQREPSGRETGIILELGTHHPDDTDAMISIVKVLWNTGFSGWIETERVIPLIRAAV